MLHKDHKLCLDFQRPEFPQLLRMHDGGNGLHRRLTIHLFANGMPELISGCTFSLHWRKGDGTAGDCDLPDATIDGHKVTFELPREILSGNPEVNVWLHIQDNHTVLHTFRLAMFIAQLPHGP